MIIIIACYCYLFKQCCLLNIVSYKFTLLEFTHSGSINRNNLQRGQITVLRCVKQVVLPASLSSFLVLCNNLYHNIWKPVLEKYADAVQCKEVIRTLFFHKDLGDLGMYPWFGGIPSMFLMPHCSLCKREYFSQLKCKLF